MKKQPYNHKEVKEIVSFQISGRLRAQLYLYAEDNECTISEVIRDGIRNLTAKQAAEYKNGRRPL